MIYNSTYLANVVALHNVGRSNIASGDTRDSEERDTFIASMASLVSRIELSIAS